MIIIIFWSKEIFVYSIQDLSLYYFYGFDLIYIFPFIHSFTYQELLFLFSGYLFFLCVLYIDRNILIYSPLDFFLVKFQKKKFFFCLIRHKVSPSCVKISIWWKTISIVHVGHYYHQTSSNFIIILLYLLKENHLPIIN